MDWKSYQRIKLHGKEKVDYGIYKTVLVEIEDHVAKVTLNRPEVLNTLDAYLHRELSDVFDDFERDDNIRAVVLTGAGRAFSAGGDLRWLRDHVQNPEKVIPIPLIDGIRLLYKIIDLPKPVIAAVNGVAIGAGATIALACDIIIAAEDATFSDPHVSVGLSAGDGGSLLWPLVMGLNKAKEYLFTGEAIKATEAASMGMVNKVVPREEVIPTAMAMAKSLVDSASMAIAYTKMSVNLVLKQRLNLILQSSLALEYLTMLSPDHIEGVNAFLEKRKPKWSDVFEY